MALRKGNAVQSDPVASKQSTENVDLDLEDDTPPPPAEELAAAPPQGEPTPDPVDRVSTQEAAREQRDQAQTQVVARQNTDVSTQINTGNVQQQLEEQGFEGLNFGFGSFPLITLQNTGIFESSDGGDLGTGFNCILKGSKQKWIYKNDQKGKEEDFFYAYEDEYATDGSLIADLLKAWAAQGWKYEKKPYLDVQAVLATGDEDDGQLVILSIPKTSIARFSGYVATLAARGLLVSEVVTAISLGDKVTKVAYPFHPWRFTIAQ